MRELAEWFVVLVEIAAAAMVGNDLGAWIKRRDDVRREEREAIETCLRESNAYREYARRKVWAA